ncbi:MAG: orotidine-5'-phosphate decarboxylase [Clostridium sp.]|nr:orotidine-5'-phosphate decarboxylase [Clostridium sp.]
MKDVIVALDFKNREETMDLLKKFQEPIYVKVGMELFYSVGPDIVKEIKSMGHKVFLDLKFHDIPNTVRGAMRSCLSLGADMVNLHASGGSLMMKAAMEEANAIKNPPLVIGVTVLTSMDEQTLKSELNVNDRVEDAVFRLANMAKESGLPGIVCSALEVAKVKKVLGQEFLTITPGIRPKDANHGDQSRVVTPDMARELGSDFIVVGRPITKADNPYGAYVKIKNEFLGEVN